MSVLDAENVNYLWAGLLFEEWKRQGVRHVIVCPGSRSSPLAIAAARTGGLEVHVVTDERCAGFIAIGIAKARGVPAVVVTTSGTAVANLLPAVVESSMSAVPMLLVTADRPPELRECGANQSIPQADLFGRFVRWAFEFGCPSSDVDAAYALSTADEVWARATSVAPAGPAHLNCSFREPLAPIAKDVPKPSQRIQEWWQSEVPWRTERVAPEQPEALTISSVEGETRVLLAVGERFEPNASAEEIVFGPQLLDVTASLRRTKSIPVPDLVLSALVDGRCQGLRERLQPSVIIRLGGPIASKRVNEFIASCDRVHAIRHAGARMDDRHTARSIRCFRMSAHLQATLEGNREYEALWAEVGRSAERALQLELNRSTALTEPWIAHELPRRMREGHLVVGSSMPIRDVNSFWPHDARATRVIANRGASGIDGTVSTAIGVAMSSSVPTTLLLGDLALLHDLGGLANIHLAHQPLQIVVINNDGGGIFHFLPIAEHASSAPHFEKLFGTPHGLSFEHAAAMFGLEYRRAATKDEASSAFAELTTIDKPLLIECITDRATNVEAHRSIQRAVADALARDFA